MTRAALHASTESVSGDDLDLVVAARLGNQRAFGALVSRHQGLVSALAYALTGSVSQSEDIAQETFLTAWRRLPQLEPPDHFRAWLCGIVKNCTRNSRRAQRSLLSLASV